MIATYYGFILKRNLNSIQFGRRWCVFSWVPVPSEFDFVHFFLSPSVWLWCFSFERFEIVSETQNIVLCELWIADRIHHTVRVVNSMLNIAVHALEASSSRFCLSTWILNNWILYWSEEHKKGRERKKNGYSSRAAQNLCDFTMRFGTWTTLNGWTEMRRHSLSIYYYYYYWKNISNAADVYSSFSHANWLTINHNPKLKKKVP